jgi:predicted DsbA family dithiol-disulfide isomerase
VDRYVSTGDASAPGDAEGYLWKEVLTSDAFQKRLEKGIRNANEIDHDDSPYFIPALKQSEIESACGSSGGETKKFTIQGYKNAYVGFGMRLRSLQEKYEEEKQYKEKGQVSFENQYLQKLITTFQSFMKYDGILDNRYNRKAGSRLQRFSSHDYRSGCIWDANRALYIYQNEMQDLIKEIATAYGQGDNPELVEKPFKRLPSIKGKKELEKEQTEIEHAIENFGTDFENMVMQDGGKKMVEILDKHKFKAEDLEDLSEEEKIKNKMNMELFDAARTKTAEEE